MILSHPPKSGASEMSAPAKTETPGLTSAEISALLAAAHDLPPKDGLRPHTYGTLFGLLACTGLRLKEALRLTRSDVDFTRGLLTIRETKFRKSRLVPLHPTTTRALRGYARLRDRHPRRAECRYQPHRE